MHREPTSYQEALDSEKWREAMATEMKSLEKHKVWRLTELPPGKKVVGCRWVYKVKTDETGKVERYKARLVAQGFSQQRGADYDETFCPDARLREMGFQQTPSDPCIYRSKPGREDALIGVYVDDIVLAGKIKKRIQEVKKQLSKTFDIKDLGKLRYFLGISVEQQEEQGQLWFGQPAYSQQVLENYGMSESKAIKTPVGQSQKLRKAAAEEDSVDQTKYQSLVGSMMYLSVCTRPDLSFAVNSLAKFSNSPTQEHWTAAKRVLRYLKGTTDLGIQFARDETGEVLGYTDVDWGGDPDDKKFTSGYIFTKCGGAISWRQQTVALSMAEAKYVVASAAAVWLRQLTTPTQGSYDPV